MSAKFMQEGVRSIAVSWRGPAAMTLTNGIVEATLLAGGGHLARYGFAAGHGPSQQNVLWEAPWRTVDPGSLEHAAIVEELGDKVAGRFLASYTGHALFLDRKSVG